MRKLVNGEYVDLTEEEVAEYESNLPTADDLQKQYLVECELAIENYITSQVQSLGYRNEDSLSKYMARASSPWNDECIALGNWIDACWIEAHTLLNAGQVLTAEEIILAMPKFSQDV